MNPVYGIGFRKAHAALQGRSLDDMLAHVKESPQILIYGFQRTSCVVVYCHCWMLLIGA